MTQTRDPETVIAPDSEDEDPLAFLSPEPHPCEYAGCTSYAAMPCVLPLDTEPPTYYCPEHAAVQGFCPGCGCFIAGTRCGEAHGLCDNCYDELSEPDYEDDDYYPYDPY